MTRPTHVVICEKRFPLPPNHGRATRVITLSGELRDLGFQVTVLACEGHPTTLDDGTRIRTIPPLSWPLREIVIWAELLRIRREEPVDFLQVQNDIFVLAAVLARLSGFRLTYDAQVVEADYWSALRPRTLRERASSIVLPFCERLLCRLSDRVSAVSAQDARRLEESGGLPPGKVKVIPAFARPGKVAAPTFSNPDARPIVLFLGSYDHRPNADAIELIAREIQPRVLEKVPAAVFSIVGKGLPVDVLGGHGLDPHSDVPAVGPFIDAATVCIAPVRVGSGVRTKLIEYMSRGKPVVAMTAALEGLALEPDVDLLVADDVDGFADRIVTLLNNGDLRTRLGRSGFERMNRLIGKEAIERALADFYREPVSS